MNVKRTPDWGVIASVASVTIAGMALYVSMQDKDAERDRKRDDRLCRLESAAKLGECGR